TARSFLCCGAAPFRAWILSADIQQCGAARGLVGPVEDDRLAPQPPAARHTAARTKAPPRRPGRPYVRGRNPLRRSAACRARAHSRQFARRCELQARRYGTALERRATDREQRWATRRPLPIRGR